MELLIALLAIFIIIILFIINFVKFSNFKSLLMRALVKEGLPYKNGNDLYTRHAKLVAKLHKEGLLPEDIARGLVSGIDISVDDDTKAKIRELYKLSGQLASKLNGDREHVGFNIFLRLTLDMRLLRFHSLFASITILILRGIL